MPYTAVTYSEKVHVARITLNCAEANNAVNLHLAQELVNVCLDKSNFKLET